MSSKLLEGERALIAGCAGGIGRGIAQALTSWPAIWPSATAGRSCSMAPSAGSARSRGSFHAASPRRPAGWRPTASRSTRSRPARFPAAAALVAQIPLGRPGTPDDIAQVAVAVLSERFGRYVVGTTVEVDGGIGLISWLPSKA
jgi:NAD(P)-dependent dehydrogenase (short-subunit alcohol dehydrogenase family)